MSARRAVVVGAGAMGRTWARTIAAHSGCVLAGWADAEPGKAERAVSELGLDCPAGEDFLPLALGVGAEFVVDATPPWAHHGVTVAALGSGLAVLGEKPMACSLEEAREMIAAADRAGRLYMVSQNRRYNPWLEAFRDAARSVGPTGILTVDFFIGPHFGGFRDEMDSPLLLDMAVHTFDQARFVLGADAESVVCEEFDPPWSWYRGRATAWAGFVMTDGCRFHYRGCWCAEGQDTGWEGEWRAVGPRGAARWDGAESVRTQETVSEEGFLRPTVRRDWRPEDEARPRDVWGSLTDFLNALETGAAPHGHCRDNFKTLAMALAAVESARSGLRTLVPRE